jgi:hypothetical protein
MTHDEAADKLARVFAAHRCEDDSLRSDVRALWYADVEELELAVQQAESDRDARVMEIVALRERNVLLEAVREESELVCNNFYMAGTTKLRDLLAACQPAPVCKVCDGDERMHADSGMVVPCPVCQPAPEKGGDDA